MLAHWTNTQLSANPSKTARVRASTTRKKYASWYARVMTLAPSGTTNYVPFLLTELSEFEQQNTNIPQDVQALLSILRSQVQNLLQIEIDTEKYKGWIKYLSESAYKNPIGWYHAHVARPIREGKMSHLGQNLKKPTQSETEQN
jgi:hypothetical protein